MEEFFLERAIKPRIDMEMGSNEAIKQAVVAGLGISFISQHTLGLELSAGRLVVLKVEGTPVMRRWFLVRHKSKRLTPALGAFWDFVLEFAPGLPEEGWCEASTQRLRCQGRGRPHRPPQAKSSRCGQARQWITCARCTGMDREDDPGNTARHLRHPWHPAGVRTQAGCRLMQLRRSRERSPGRGHCPRRRSPSTR
jgi:hypothetical protein